MPKDCVAANAEVDSKTVKAAETALLGGVDMNAETMTAASVSSALSEAAITALNATHTDGKCAKV